MFSESPSGQHDMVTTCFFCQNLLSDYLEGILPSVRHEEITKHLNGCETCKKTKEELESSLKLLSTIERPLIEQALSIRVEEACLSGKSTNRSREKWIKYNMYWAVPVFLLSVLIWAFPSVFPWFSYLRNYEDESNFSRYFPLLQGASEIIDEQANWLHSRDPLGGSLWEEGGMTPEEYEKAFQKKPIEEIVP